MDKKALETYLEPVRKFSQKYGAQIFIGEFGAIRWADRAGKYMEDCISVFEANRWHWAYHAFREWHGWSVEMEDGGDAKNFKYAKTDSSRKRAVLKGFAKNANSYGAEKKQKSEVSEKSGNKVAHSVRSNFWVLSVAVGDLCIV